MIDDLEYRQEIRICGSGGQGVIMVAIILAEAVAIFEGRQVSQTQSYGPEARGGKCKADVVISNLEIDYPKASKPSILLAMNQASYDFYIHDLMPGGILIVDSTMVKKLCEDQAIAIPFTHLARKNFGRTFVANMIALGSLIYLCPVASLESVESALLGRVPEGTKDINLKAFRAGVEAAENYKK